MNRMTYLNAHLPGHRGWSLFAGGPCFCCVVYKRFIGGNKYGMTEMFSKAEWQDRSYRRRVLGAMARRLDRRVQDLAGVE